MDHPRPQMEDRWALANQDLLARIRRGEPGLPEGRIGDPARYAAEASAGGGVIRPPAVARRDWQNWDRWERRRIERIVDDERRRPREISARALLAEVVARLALAPGSDLRHARVLDVGCGPGALWPRFESLLPKRSWMGVDVTHAMLAAARALFPHVPVCEADSSALPFEAGAFEVVVLRHVLEHLPDWLMRQALHETVRVARRALLIDFYVPPLRSGTPRTSRVGDGFLETQWTVEAFEAPIREAGWRVQERFSIQGLPEESGEVWVFGPAPAAPGSIGPKISIVMATYRRPHTITRAVETIRAQTYQNWELIIVDNSGNGGYHFDDPRICVVDRTLRISASYARNEGLSLVSGELVCFFDDDDEMFPTYLERFVAAFAANPRAKMACCGMYVTDERVNFTFATPECCLRREFATATWGDHSSHDQLYFSSIVRTQRWSEENGDIVTIREALCRANADPVGGLRSGSL